MQRLFFVALIFSNLLFIQGQEGPASSLTKTEEDYNIDDLYEIFISRARSMRSACQTEECKVDELIKKFSAESQTAPPIKPTGRPSYMGGILGFLLEKKKEFIGQLGGPMG